MRILNVVTQLESGGAQTVAVDLHREFVRRGVTSKLVFLYEKDPAVFPQRDYTTLAASRPAGPLAMLRVVARLRALWAKFKPDVIIPQTHFSNNICAMLKATGLGGDVLAVHQNVVDSYPRAALWLDAAARRLKLYRAEVSVSDPVLDSLPAARGGDPRRVVVLNSQGLSRSVMNRSTARHSFGLPQDAFLAGNIGRLSEQKNQSFLVDLLARMPALHVAILGEGHLREELLAQAARLGVADRLILLGATVRERVPDFLAALDAFVMPSLHEGLSLAMLEALGAGVPFVGHDVPTIASVVHGGIGGAGIVLPLDPARWQGALESLRDDPAARAALIARERTRAGDFSVETMADNYLAAARAAAA